MLCEEICLHSITTPSRSDMIANWPTSCSHLLMILSLGKDYLSFFLGGGRLFDWLCAQVLSCFSHVYLYGAPWTIAS